MSSARPGGPGATRECPHCKEAILQSANVCPACRHHLRFDPDAGPAVAAAGAITALRVEGSIRHPADASPWEYSVVVTVRNDRGEEIARKLVGVGALDPDEQRSFTLSVEMSPSSARAGAKSGSRH